MIFITNHSIQITEISKCNLINLIDIEGRLSQPSGLRSITIKITYVIEETSKSTLSFALIF